MARIRAAKFDDRLTLIEHLDELRTRILISLGTLGTAAGLCFWQNDRIIEIANQPLPSRGGELIQPITFSPTEPFMTTLTLSVYAALLLSLPVILYQAYAFVIPAFSPSERRTVLPLILLIPVLFVAGAVFAYFALMPIALDFLLSFNADNFNIELRARDYYSFIALSLIAFGVLFQIPVGILAVTRLGVITPEQLRANRRYAILGIAVVSMLVTSPDPATMLITMVPLILLYELSVLLALWLGRPREPAEAELAAAERGP